MYKRILRRKAKLPEMTQVFTLSRVFCSNCPAFWTEVSEIGRIKQCMSEMRDDCTGFTGRIQHWDLDALAYYTRRVCCCVMPSTKLYQYTSGLCNQVAP